MSRCSSCLSRCSATASVLALELGILLISVTFGQAQNDRPHMNAARCRPRLEDYTFMWWAHGFRGRSPQGRWLRCIQTGSYAMAMDVGRLQITHLGSVTDPLPYEQAALQDNGVYTTLPGASLQLVVTVDSTPYHGVRGGEPTQHSGPRLIESGRFLQRADITNLVFEDKEGRKLAADARLEVVAWPDRLTLLLDVRPKENWTIVSAAISLSQGAGTVADRVELKPGEIWKSGTSKTAAVSLLPGTPLRHLVSAAPPTVVKAATIRQGRSCPVDHNAVRGWYRIDLDGVEPEGLHNDSIERVRLSIANPEEVERPVRLLFSKTGSGIRVRGMSAITGVSPMLRDREGNPVGIPVQISKNWHRQRDRDLTYQGVWLHAFTMLRLPPQTAVELEFTLVYAHWGGVAAASHAQLCLIGWGSNQLWDQSAIGAWGETLCYEPDQAQAEAAVLDVRPLMVSGMQSDQRTSWRWTNNVGGADFFRYYNAKGERQFPARMKTAYRRYGPNLTEVTYAGQSQDATFEHCATVSTYRTDDITRGVYRLRMEVKERFAFTRLVFFQTGSDTYSYTGERAMALGNEKGLTREWETRWGAGVYKTSRMPCTGRIPWVSLHRAVSRDSSKSGAWANRGIVIRRWDARVGGVPVRPWVAEYGVRARGRDTSLVDVLLPPEVKRLDRGDYIEATIEHSVVPQYARDYYGPNRHLRTQLEKHENTWRMIYREAVGNDLEITVTHGRLERLRPTRLRAGAGNRAQFTITGGVGYVPITIGGLSDYRNPVLEMRESHGPWRQVDQSVYGKDFWQADYATTTQTWDIIYTVPLDTPGDARKSRELRFRVGPTED